jgi:3-oxoadipate enol-lactonase
MPMATINDHRLYYEVHGDGPATVVLSHGFILDHEMWADQVQALKGSYRVVVWDERGHGRSECNGPFTFWDSAADLVGLLDEVEADSAALVGMSQGGWVSVRAALSHPDRVQGLVLVDSTTQAFTADAQDLFIQMADAWSTAGPSDELCQAMIGMQFSGGYDPSRWVAKWRARPPRDWRTPWDAIIHRLTTPEEVLDARLSEITCPVQIIHGSEDTGFALEQAYEMAGWFPNCGPVVVVADAGHCPPITHPQEVNTALSRFLAAVPAR